MVRPPILAPKAPPVARPAGRAARSFLVAANRLPVHRATKVQNGWVRSPGGLVSALAPILERRAGTWIGWSGARGAAHAPFDHQGITNVPIAISRGEARDYYEGFSNATLWPLYHDCVRPPEFRREWWAPYLEVNRRFAEAADAWAGEGATVWVHDYHLQLVPALLRERRPDLRIGFFLHIPFPPAELFQQLPWRTAMLEGLLGADLVGFQTRAGAENFARLCRRFLDTKGTEERIVHGGRTVQFGAYPISIDFARFDALAADPRIQARVPRIRGKVGWKCRILLGIDRLDYTKGIDVRLEAFRTLIASGRYKPGECVLLQTAVPSRERVNPYRRVKAQIEELVGRINGEFGALGQPVIHYLHKTLSQEELVGMYSAADVLLVTPLRDGMNLVAKEFVASRRDERGALVLSEFTGAARELERALIVNPHDVDGLVETMARALELTPDEQGERMRAMRTVVREHDVHAWARSFLEDLGPGEFDDPKAGRPARGVGRLSSPRR